MPGKELQGDLRIIHRFFSISKPLVSWVRGFFILPRNKDLLTNEIHRSLIEKPFGIFFGRWFQPPLFEKIFANNGFEILPNFQGEYSNIF